MQPKLKATPILGLTALTALFLTAALPRQAAAQFTITANFINENMPGHAAPSPNADADVQNALNFFASNFKTNGTASFAITENITWADLGASGLGGSINGNSSFQNENGTLYINPLDRYLFGDKAATSGPGYTDINLVFNNSPKVPLDYTLGTPSDFNTYSLATSVYHETLHGMGFGAGINQDGSQTFGTPTIFTKFLTDANGTPIDSLTDAQRAAVIIGGPGALLFAGPNAEAAHGGKPVVMYAPTTFEPGSSDGSHIDDSEPAGGPLYSGLFNGQYLPPTALNLAMMQDIGWKLSSPAAVPEASTTVSLGLLLAFGLGGMVFAAKKRKVTSKAD